jgi:hypothetical protein
MNDRFYNPDLSSLLLPPVESRDTGSKMTGSSAQNLSLKQQVTSLSKVGNRNKNDRLYHLDLS